ncbi:MAG: hypothetical protein OEV44_13225 [Spirochaetota bacterium]|nr:hypothetical protein [Spirochaetota bacterium]
MEINQGLQTISGLSTEDKQDEIIANQTDGSQKTKLVYIKNPDGEESDVTNNNPLPVDGDSVYSKDIWETDSDMGNFSGEPIDLFNNLTSIIADTTTNNPKTLEISFNRTIVSNTVGLGTFSGNFSNVKIEIKNSGGVFTTVIDESTVSTKYTNRTFQLPITAGFNALRLTFHTVDTVTLSNCVVLKTRSVVARVQAVSSINNKVEDISSFRKALDINNAWRHRKIVNETFHKHTGTLTNPSAPITPSSVSVTVASPTGFATGGKVKLSEVADGVGFQEIGLLTITNVTGSVVTFDRPIGNAYTVAATLEVVLVNMNVNGSLDSPVIFEIDPPVGNIWQFTRLLISIVSAAAADDSKFGGITGGLTNGVCVRATTASGRTVVFANWKKNNDMKLDMYDVDYTDKSGGGNYGVNGRWTLTTAEIVAELDGDASPLQKLEVIIQDNLSSLIDFKIRGQGRVEKP